MKEGVQKAADAGGTKGTRSTRVQTKLTWRSRIKLSDKTTRKTRTSFPVWRKKKRRQKVP